MSRGVRFEPEASDELDEAAVWYEHRATGLGTKFLGAVDQTVAMVTRWPQAAPLATDLPNDLIVRLAQVHQFPYRLVYLQTPTAIRVLAWLTNQGGPVTGAGVSRSIHWRSS